MARLFGRLKERLSGRLKRMWYGAMPMREASRANRIIDNKMAADQHDYVDIPVWVLRIRMKQEHERDQFIDAKTDRLGQRILGMLAFVGVLLAILAEKGMRVAEPVFPVVEWSALVAWWIALGYILRAWWLTVRANATTKVYGFGTDFEFQGNRDQETLRRELFCQEMENNKKQNINVASVHCLRNAVVVGILGALIRLSNPLIHLITGPS